MALLFLYRGNNHHGEYNQNWSHDGLHHDTKHLLLGDSPSHSKLSFHLFDFTFGQKSSTALETQLADSLAVVAEEQHRDGEVLRFSSLMEICRSRCGTPRVRSRCPATQRRWGGEGGIWDGLGSLWIEYHMVGILFGLVWFGEWNRKVIEEVDTEFMGLSNRGQQRTRHYHYSGYRVKKGSERLR